MNISTVFALFVEIYARLSQYFAQNRPIVALNIVGVVLGADTQLVAAVVVTHDAALQAVLIKIFLQNLKFFRNKYMKNMEKIMLLNMIFSMFDCSEQMLFAVFCR